MARPVIVLAHPHDDTREMYADFLHHKGITVLAAEDSEGALQLACKADVIVTGIRLQRQHDGIELVERLRGDATLCHVPIVVLTACALATDRAHAEEAGCDEFLLIPCLPDDLYRAVRRVLLGQIPVRTVKADRSRPAAGQQHHKPRRRA